MAVATASGHASEGDFDRVLVVDFGAQYAQLIARRVREARVFSEIVPRDITAAEVAAKNPVGIILSGGPASVYAEDAYDLDPSILELDIPVLGICYGHQVLAKALGGTVSNTGRSEFGAADLTVDMTDVATVNGIGTRPISQHGFCWALGNNEPTTNDFTTALGNLSSQGIFNSTLNTLITDSTYYIRAYITNDQTTIYSNTLTFTIGNANVATGNIQINSSSEATAIGTVTGLGVESIIQHGHCWSAANPTPTTNDSKTELGATNSAGDYQRFFKF